MLVAVTDSASEVAQLLLSSTATGQRELRTSVQALYEYGEVMSALCSARRIDPRSVQCWQWVVDEDQAGRFAPAWLREAPGR